MPTPTRFLNGDPFPKDALYQGLLAKVLTLRYCTANHSSVPNQSHRLAELSELRLLLRHGDVEPGRRSGFFIRLLF